MGTNLRIISMYGLELPYDQEFSDFYYDMKDIPEMETPLLWIDGMCGEKMWVGVPLYISTDFRYEWPETNDTKKYDLGELFQLEMAYRNEFIRVFPEWKHLVDGNFKLFTFEYYS